MSAPLQPAASSRQASSTRRAIIAPSRKVVTGSTMQNSSPPVRASRSPGRKPRLRHQREMLQAGVAGGVAVAVVDFLEAVEIDHQERKGLAGALRDRAFLVEPAQQLAAVGDAGEIVEQRQIGDLGAQPVDRHQHEAEIPRHRQEYQQQDQRRLEFVEAHHRDFAADMQHARRRRGSG